MWSVYLFSAVYFYLLLWTGKKVDEMKYLAS